MGSKKSRYSTPPTQPWWETQESHRMHPLSNPPSDREHYAKERLFQTDDKLNNYRDDYWSTHSREGPHGTIAWENVPLDHLPLDIQRDSLLMDQYYQNQGDEETQNAAMNVVAEAWEQEHPKGMWDWLFGG